MLGMARPTTFTDESGELVVVNQGYGTEEDHRVLEEYENWLVQELRILNGRARRVFQLHYEVSSPNERSATTIRSCILGKTRTLNTTKVGWCQNHYPCLFVTHGLLKTVKFFDPTFDVLRRDMNRKEDERIYYYGTHIPADFIVLFMN